MNNDRYPKMCMLRQISLMPSDKKSPEYIWHVRIDEVFFDKIGESTICQDFSKESLIGKKQKLIQAFSTQLKEIDLERKDKASTLILYPSLEIDVESQEYFSIDMPLQELRVLIQLRLANPICQKFVYDSKVFVLGAEAYCNRCSKQANEAHLLIDCESHIERRKKSLLPTTTDFDLKLLDILENPNKTSLKSLIKLLIEILRDEETVTVTNL
ncbi:hypothetical protein QAD02_013915 [Eretmocerus hayati]|uniref:Uncharacterized protein n=1 Tax=Eretmocerus hayati TaxID=131215 RepID=A0ACC2P3T3_9HYME|nr:hypothetical protein QAD02_013915 [Eretmocerus hayati]